MTKNYTREPLIEDNITYDPETGLFKWLDNVKVNGFINKGWFTGSNRGKGYFQIRVLNKIHYAHRLAWYLMHGEFPKDQIDHMNSVRGDNRLCNLRVVTHAQNSQNMKKAKGTAFERKLGKWQARIYFQKNKIYLGLFNTEEEAHQAYLAKKRELFEYWVD